MIIVSGKYTYVLRNQAAALFEDRWRLIWRGSMLESIPEGVAPLEVLLDLSVRIKNSSTGKSRP